MKRYSDDYCVDLYYDHKSACWRAAKRRPLTRQQAARVVAEPLPKRISGLGKATAGALVSGRAFDLTMWLVWAALIAILIWG